MLPSRGSEFQYRCLDLQRFSSVGSVLQDYLKRHQTKVIHELRYLDCVFFLSLLCFFYGDLCFQYPVVHQKILHVPQFWYLKTKIHFQKA